MPATASTEALHAVELFSSLQGEGLWIGSRQIFFRLAFCNLDCGYCDTEFAAQPSCRIEVSPGSSDFEPVANPVSLPRILAVLDRWSEASPDLHQALSLTGGEPLCQAEALIAWLPELAKRLPLHLETNGTRPADLERLLPWIDFISLDIKLVSATGQPTPWAEHRECLQASSHLDSQVKCVVGETTSAEEIAEAAGMVAEAAPETVLILQPVTRQERPAVSGDHMLKLQQVASRIFRRVRVIPQVHPLLRIL